MTTPDMSQPNSFDLSLDLAPFEPLTPTARDARDAMLQPLRAKVVARRRRRVAARALAACVLAIVALASVRLLSTPATPLVPHRGTAHVTPPTPSTAPSLSTPNTAIVPAKKFAITIVQSDPTVLERLSAKPPASPIVTSLTDDELLDALQAAGTPGLIKINGKVVLSRDLFKPAEADAKPQSRSTPADHTHG